MKSNINPEYLIEVRKIYGTWIRRAREEKGLTQQQLAELIGIGQTTVSKIEEGKWNFGIDTLTIFAEKLDFFLFFVEKDSKDELAAQMRDRWKHSHGEN